MTVEFDFSRQLAELLLWHRVTGVAAVSVSVLFTAFLLGLGRRRPRLPRSLRALHQARTATASMEYLLVLMPFMIIVMTVWQFAFMANARLHVGYAAFAAARSAAVMIPAEFDKEPEGILKGNSKSPTSKWARIHKAAIPGTLSVSPGHAPTAIAVAAIASAKENDLQQLTQVPQIQPLIARLTLMGLHHPSPGITSGNRMSRTLVKSAFADKMTRVTINGASDKKNLDLSGTDLVTTVDKVTVQVDYIFWLHVPYVGKIMEAIFDNRPKIPFTNEYIFLNPYPSMKMSETVTMTVWPRHRVIKPCN